MRYREKFDTYIYLLVEPLRPIAMAQGLVRKTAYAGLVLFLLFVNSTVTNASSAQCKDQDVRRSAPQGELVITEFAVTYHRSPCPTERVDIQTPISVRHGIPLWLWIRLEGNLAYLKSRYSRLEVYMVVARLVENVHVPEFIPLSSIDRDQARGEAEIDGNRGYFDWRMDGYKAYFFIPGTYAVEFAQGDKHICFNTGYQRTCRIEFIVQ
jgi:hypothetical protein